MKKNYHRAKPINLGKIKSMIKKYPQKFPTPKYMTFVESLIHCGFLVKVYQARVSKYVFVKKDGEITKIRFSNHKPRLDRETEEDCDYYVGISNFQTSKTEEVVKKILTPTQ